MHAHPHQHVVRTFVVATERRDKNLYPSGSDFTYQLPATLTNVVGVGIRDYKFGNEMLINENNKMLRVYGDSGAVDGSIELTVGNYSNDINLLLTHINTLLDPYKVQFSINNTTSKVQLTFTNSSGITDFFAVEYNAVLRILGFDSGIAIYRATTPTGIPFQVAASLTTSNAVNAYDVYNNPSELVVRITDVETLLSNDAVTNRCTAILFNDTNSSTKTVRQCQDRFTPLLQVQSRLQALRIKLLNLDGDLYDTVKNEVILVIEFYCMP